MHSGAAFYYRPHRDYSLDGGVYRFAVLGGVINLAGVGLGPGRLALGVRGSVELFIGQPRFKFIGAANQLAINEYLRCCALATNGGQGAVANALTSEFNLFKY